ncbi:hypothetical protein NC661_14160 [Aquibacillus koreensis]|uniref:Uncharacterized protein n=1 Tax=Aquibacillus koreensis TaxID=279446 RepID=A0A9X3WKM2_9BACI|nr:hypothetical protein [Aquibacillus koreensis]MCT2536727.1 hypothetical protein [Aquibacillus koreensis]MDC3421517.1 hypothetical protein [Aquibacillus koreensis]
MNLFLNLQKINFLQAVLSFRFLFSSFLVFITITATTLAILDEPQDVIALLEFGLTGSHGSLMLIMGTLPLLPFAISFAVEWEQKSVLFWVIRTGVNRYAISKIITGAFSAFLVTAVGLSIFVLAMDAWLPIYDHSYGVEAYQPFLTDGQITLYLLFRISHISLTSVLFAILAFWVSTMIPNKYVAMAAPVVFYFIAHRLTTTLNIPVYLKALTIIEGQYDAGSPLSTILLKAITVLVLSLPLAYLSVRNIRRRIIHD